MRQILKPNPVSQLPLEQDIALETLYVNLEVMHDFVLRFRAGQISLEEFTRSVMQHARNVAEVSLTLSEAPVETPIERPTVKLSA